MTLNNERLTEQILLFIIVKVTLQQNQQNNDFLKIGDKNHTCFSILWMDNTDQPPMRSAILELIEIV